MSLAKISQFAYSTHCPFDACADKCPLCSVGGNRSTRKKPTTFGRALTRLFSHEDWVRIHIKMTLLGIELGTLEVKGEWSDHYTTEAPRYTYKYIQIYIYTKSKVNSNGVCNYYDFISREGLSLAIWFDIVEFRENMHMTVKIFANVHQLMFLVLKLVWIRIEYSLV